ncbi:Glutathione S-transferase theta-1 [Phytophthora pseudosyringae]|uniref:Glutathione S-transferase theta-1 n=1 Tax=Phytophthora pseudosyringae TaxID=221518 RepID=A0A8T1VSD4_9STRA|nr:Glutathione S-transferase theta-1 [Phytophthora pseudosyringae]
MTLTLYANLISQPSRTVAWVLKVKGIEHEFVPVAPGNDFFKSDEFTAINPNRLVPVIKDDDFVLTEGMAILQYLGDRFDWTGPKDLYPKDLRVRAKINEFLHWHHTNTRLFTLNIVRPEISKKLKAATPKDLAALEGKDALVEKEFALLETFLADDFIARTAFPTIADFTAYCEIDQLELMGYDFSKYPKVSAWIARMKTQPFNDEIHEPLKGFVKQFGLDA